MGSMPVASGSRLPTWPALSTPSVRRTRCSAALDDRPSGLSSSRIPLSIDRDGSGLAVVVPFAILGDGAVDQSGEVRGLIRRVVWDKFEPRGVPQPQAPANLATQESTGASESDLHLLHGIPRGKR